MPSKDRHGKTAQDCHSVLIAKFDAVPLQYRHRKAKGSLQLFVWIISPVTWHCVDWPSVRCWLHNTINAELPLEVPESPAPAPNPAATLAITATKPLDACFAKSSWTSQKILPCYCDAILNDRDLHSAFQGIVPAYAYTQDREKVSSVMRILPLYHGRSGLYPTPSYKALAWKIVTNRSQNQHYLLGKKLKPQNQISTLKAYASNL